MAWIRVEDREAVRWLVLDRPERGNAIPTEGWPHLQAALEAFEASDRRVLVITGAGGGFCEGAELELARSRGGVLDHRGTTRRMGEVAATLHRIGKPTVAAVDGLAAGAGLSLALACDVVVATHRARFSAPAVRRGHTLELGGSWLLPRTVGLQRAKELVLSGRVVEPEEAVRIGLCLEAVDPEQLEARVGRIVEGFLAGAPFAQTLVKQAIDRSWEVSFEEALGWEAQSLAICLSSEDAGEGRDALLQRREPRWSGR